MRYFFDNSWLLFLTICVGLFISALLGYRLALSTRINEDSHHHEHITALREGLFVLLALLLGFTLAMVLPRYDQRRQLVIDEANAIEKTMMRAELLPEPQRGKTVDLLREYAIVRRDFARQSLQDRPSLNRETESTKALQRQLWQEMLSVPQQNQTVVFVKYLEALNDMIDVAEERLAVFQNRVPTTVWVIIFLIAVFQCTVAGLSLKRRFWFALVMTPLVVAAVIALVAELDSPHNGLITVEQNSMDRLVHDVTDAKQGTKIDSD
ncbi:MAG: hypothetical protein WB608_23840 [Terracidiphilus sp.]